MTAGDAIERVFAQAIEHHQRGDLQQAEQLYRQVLSQRPDHAHALHYLGVVAHQVGQHAAALDLINRSLACDPSQSRFYNNAAEVLRAMGRPSDAASALRRALEISPDEPDYLGNLAIALFDLNELEEAEALFRRAIAGNPALPEPHLHLSRLLQKRGRMDDALREAKQAVEVAPGHHNASLNLAMILLADKQLEEAETICRRTISAAPNYSMAYSALGSVLGAKRDHSAAADAFARSVSLNPNDHSAWNGLGVALLQCARFKEAGDAFTNAARLKPDSAGYYNNLASALEEQGEVDEALRVFEHAAAIDPKLATARSNVGKRLMLAGRVDEAISHFRRALELDPTDSRVGNNLLLALHYVSDLTPEAIFREHAAWEARHARPLKRSVRREDYNLDPNRRLKIGYVSADFCAHSVADFIEPILAHHDQSRFETTCFSDVRRPDAYTARIKPHAGHWIETAHLTDDELASLVGERGIDILIDLAGHTANNRLLTFARKPAPVQVTYLGYPDTTGLTTIDWRLTHALADPVGMTESLHTERLYRLPRSFLCYQPFVLSDELAARRETDDDKCAITFASFNSLSKVTPTVVEAWSRVLHATPGSRMLVKALALQGMARDRLLALFAGNGIAPDRIELLGRIADFGHHLELYNRVDIALDTFPYHGTTTTCEALWMGVPVVTLAGRAHVSRVGVSLLNQVNLGNLVADNPDQYVSIATALAGDRLRLRELRSNLRDRMRQSPLLDAPGVTRDLEHAYRQMWLHYVAS